MRYGSRWTRSSHGQRVRGERGRLPASSMAEALKSVMSTKRALAVKRMKVVQTTAMATLRRRRSLGVNTCFSASSPLRPEELEHRPLGLLRLELVTSETWQPTSGVSCTATPASDAAPDRIPTIWPHTTAGASEKATFFLRESLSLRMIDKRRQLAGRLPVDSVTSEDERNTAARVGGDGDSVVCPRQAVTVRSDSVLDTVAVLRLAECEPRPSLRSLEWRWMLMGRGTVNWLAPHGSDRPASLGSTSR